MPAPPGTFVLVPPGIEHGFRNDQDRPVRMFNIHAPAGSTAASASRPDHWQASQSSPRCAASIEHAVTVAFSIEEARACAGSTSS